MNEQSHDDPRRSCIDPKFLPSIFFGLIDNSSTFLSELYKIRKEAEQSYYFDLSVIQDSFRFRSLNRARAIAHALIDDKGEIDKKNLAHVIQELKTGGNVFYPEGYNDSLITEHMLQFLNRLNLEDALAKMIRRFQKPLCHKWAERLVLNTLGLHLAPEITNAQIRKAVLCACLTPLRQSVGSCFASAPAILIQREQVDLLVDDLFQLLSTGILKRTFAGVEYSVPLSPNIGVGDLRKNLFLLDSKAVIWFSPGLIAACETLGIIPSDLTHAKKVQLLKEKLPQFTEGKRKITVEDLIKQILYKELGISEEELHRISDMERLQLKTNQLLTISSDKRTSEKLENRELFIRKEKEARAAFTSVCDNALLKAWEFTLASFSDVKMEFSRWNLYQSLGLSVEEHGGIGELIFKRIDDKLQQINTKIEHFQQECKAAFDAVKATESLLRGAGSETEARRLQAEYQSRSYHMQTCLEMRDQLYSQGSHYSTLFNFLINHYNTLFPEYFQEIYDPEMVRSQAEIHEDSLAGFRLVYKHGRANPSQWSLIYDAQTYIDYLVDFFSNTESRLTAEMQWEEGKSEIVELTSALIVHLRSDIFLQSALTRMSKAHENTMGRPEREKKPWGYISGGTMTTLLKTYFRRESEYSKEEKWVENESELLIFIIDSLKVLPPNTTDPFLSDRQKGMLTTSPTHAFILLPGQNKLSEGWQDQGFTYTWVRDHIILPGQKFYTDMHLSTTQQIFLLDEFCRELPPILSHDLHKAFHVDHQSISVMRWRNKTLETLIICSDSQHPVQKRALADALDIFLYQILPIIPASEYKPLIRKLLADVYDDKCKELLYTLSEVPCAYMSAKKIKELAKACYIQSRHSIFSSIDLHQYIADKARLIGLSPPTSLIFADTNWANQFFGFVINPGTNQLELWSLDRTASQGSPMSDWKHWLNGTNRSLWTLFTHPPEYQNAPARPASHHIKFI